MTQFANPYLRCLDCGTWVDGFIDGEGRFRLIPCGHRDYEPACPSWNPVDGCNCSPKGHARGYVPGGKVP